MLKNRCSSVEAFVYACDRRLWVCVGGPERSRRTVVGVVAGAQSVCMILLWLWVGFVVVPPGPVESAHSMRLNCTPATMYEIKKYWHPSPPTSDPFLFLLSLSCPLAPILFPSSRYVTHPDYVCLPPFLISRLPSFSIPYQPLSLLAQSPSLPPCEGGSRSPFTCGPSSPRAAAGAATLTKKHECGKHMRCGSTRTVAQLSTVNRNY